MREFTVFVCLMTLGLGLGSCSSGTQSYQRELTATEKPALHAVHARRMRQLERNLNTLMFEGQLPQTEIDADRRKYAAEMVEVADRLIETAGYIKESTVTVNFTQQEWLAWEALANELSSQLVTLRATAAAAETSRLRGVLQKIVSTCDRCHASFGGSR